MYWKASYQKAESERLRLLNELAQLKQERDYHRSLQESDRPRVPVAPSKRRRETSVQPRAKRARNHPDLDLDDDEVNLDFGSVDAATPGMLLNCRSKVLADFIQNVRLSYVDSRVSTAASSWRSRTKTCL